MTLRDRLFVTLQGLSPELDSNLTDNTALFETSILDSLVLMNLAVWIEREAKGELDLTSFDIPKEWRTPQAILSFIERHSGDANENPD